MRISIGSDHGGFLLKEELKKHLLEESFEVLDCGCDSQESVDYPLYGMRVCKNVQTKKTELGILICTTGVGMSITANKHHGIRAVLAHNADMAEYARRHNDSNVLCFGSKYFQISEAMAMVKAFVEAKFEGERHERRVNLIQKLEVKECNKEK